MRGRDALLIALLVSVLGPSPARAGEFTIKTCQSDGGFTAAAFSVFESRGMLSKRACDPDGPGLRGLVTANHPDSGTVRRGAVSAFVLAAPPGTTLSRFLWSGQARRRDCRYALQLYADRQGAPPVAIKNVRPNEGCPRPGRAQSAAWPKPRVYDVSGAVRIVQRVVCRGSARVPRCSARGLNYIRTYKAQAVVVDPSPPAVNVVQDTVLTRGEWVRGVQAVGYDASDNTGVRAARVTIAGRDQRRQERVCNYAVPVPCANGPGRVDVDTRGVPEGTQPLTATAEDAAGNSGTSSPLSVRIDNTAPGAVGVAVEGGDRWRNRNDFDVSWSNPPEPDRAPLVVAHYQVCRAGGAECTAGDRRGADIARADDVTVPAPGEWDLRVWREDAAGNEASANASVPVRLRFDPEPPELGFEPQRVDDPTQISVQVTDRVSGLAGGRIEISRQGSETWQTLATVQEGSRLVTRVDDASMAPGDYVLRAAAHDQAGNESSTDRRLDGQPMMLTLPLRVPTAIHAGVVRTRRVRTTVRRHGERRRVWRRVTVLQPGATVEFGRRVAVHGTLTNRDGQAIGGAQVSVYASTPSGPEQQAATLSTDAQGRFAYVTVADASRTLRFAYGGSPVILPTTAEVTVLTRGRSTLSTSRRTVRNGNRVVFRGRVMGRSLPPLGKLVELQVRLSRGWQTFRTPRSDAAGAWRVAYRFTRTCGVQRFRFRARVPKEAGYPFEEGGSRVVAVKVRGKPCN